MAADDLAPTRQRIVLWSQSNGRLPKASSSASSAAVWPWTTLTEPAPICKGIAGITDGGIAAVCFSDVTFDWSRSVSPNAPSSASLTEWGNVRS
jgi:hypothetical protein